MSQALDEAIFSRLRDRQVTASLHGGVWAGRAPRVDEHGRAIGLPYAVYTVVSSSPRLWTSRSSFREEHVQLTVYDRSKQAVHAHLQTLRAALAFAPLNLGGNEELLELRPLGELTRLDPLDDGVWQGVATFRILTRSAVNYLPA